MIAHATLRLSTAVSYLERLMLMGLVLAIAGFVLMNVLLRMVGITIAWADEIAVYSMIMSGFVGASLMLRGRSDPAVLLLHELFPATGKQVFRWGISVISTGFGITLIYLCWRWFNPIALMASGFDIAAFEGATFNFIYSETTPVMGLPTYWFYLIMPWFAFTVTIHAATNLFEDMGLIERPENPAGIEMDGATS